MARGEDGLGAFRKTDEVMQFELDKVGTMLQLDEEPPGLLGKCSEGREQHQPRGSNNLGGGRNQNHGLR